MFSFTFLLIFIFFLIKTAMHVFHFLMWGWGGGGLLILFILNKGLISCYFIWVELCHDSIRVVKGNTIFRLFLRPSPFEPIKHRLVKPLVIKVHIPNQDKEKSYVLWVSILSPSTIFRRDIWNCSDKLEFFIFHFYFKIKSLFILSREAVFYGNVRQMC